MALSAGESGSRKNDYAHERGTHLAGPAIERSEILRAIFATAPDCIKVVARDGRILEINAAGLRMLEAVAGESIEKASVFHFIAPEHHAMYREHHLRICAGESAAWEFDIIGLQGTRRRVQTHAAPITLADGGVAQLAITREVAPRQLTGVELEQANAKLEQSVRERTRELESALNQLTETERSFSLLVESVTDLAIFMLDPTGRIVSWNAGAKRIKGYESSEIIGEHFERFYSEEDRAQGVPMMGLRTAARDGRHETEGWRLRKDGTRFWANVIIDAIRSNGVLVGFAKITRDITERRAAEANLRQAQKMEAVGQFTGGAAHDFNNLLMAILGSLEILRKRLPDDPKLLGLLDNAVRGAKRGSSLTQRMLAFARRQDLKQETVDVANLLYNMTDLLDRSLGAAVSVELNLPANRVHVHTDPSQLENAILNLAINGRDAMASGGTLTIALDERSVSAGRHATGLATGRYACIAVSDTGSGMDAATLARATEPFFTTKGVGKGTGLGLSMVDGLVGQSGGKLIVHSDLGRGTTVEIWLPVVAGESTRMPDPRRLGDEEVTPAKVELCILVVDDDELVLANTVAMLEDLGHEVIAAASARKAIELFDANPRIELLISDQSMPVMNGLQLIEILRERRPSLPIILATGYAEMVTPIDSSIRRLAKPYTQRQLADTVASGVKGAA